MTRRVDIPQGRLVGLTLSRRRLTVAMMEGSLAGRSYTMTLALPEGDEATLEYLRDSARQVAQAAADLLLEMENDLTQGELIPLPGVPS